MKIKYILLIVNLLSFCFNSSGQQFVNLDAKATEATFIYTKANGYKGIWYRNQLSNNEYIYKYSGGMAVYPANHRPFAIYSLEAEKTFFCFGGTDRDNISLLHNVSYFDHKTKMLANPTTILNKETTDAHDNPVISMDEQGYIWIFSTSHGVTRPSYIHKSRKPYDIETFDLIQATEKVNGKDVPFNNFSYMQIWYIKGKGFLGLFTKYKGGFGDRVIGYNTSRDGIKWNEWKVIAHIDKGHYQISAEKDGKIGVAFDFHPAGKGLNYRTNLYYIETDDFGKSWHLANGEKIQLPFDQIQNPALIKDYTILKKNCYILDIAFDKRNRPMVLTISSKGYQPGPENDPRSWEFFHYDGNKWNNTELTTSDSNYDMGSVYSDNDLIRIIAPTEKGPQVYNPGGEIAVWESDDNGISWKLKRQLTVGSTKNHTYVRSPKNCHPDFYAIWADGHGRQPSQSDLHFCDKNGRVFKMPRDFNTNAINPIEVNIDLTSFPEGFSPQEVGNKLSKHFISSPHFLHGKKWIHYAEVCTWLGALRYAQVAADNELLNMLKKRFDRLLSTEKFYLPPKNHVDLNMFGCLPLEFYRVTDNKDYYDLGLSYADTQWELPPEAKDEEKAWTQKGYSWQTRLWINDMFMITILQNQAYRVTGDEKYINRAAKEMVYYLNELQRTNGLFYHAPDIPYFWSRGNGWVAAGMTELLKVLPENNPDRKRIFDGYVNMMSTLKKYQRRDGMWNQLIDQADCWAETSGSAMFIYAIITGIKKGWLDRTEYTPIARKAWLALVPYINGEGDVTEVCVGTNKKNDKQYYYDRPRAIGDYHGQAPYLWCAAALLEK